VESTLKEVLPEFLNAEVALRTIGDVSQAIDWLRSTYLYVRIQRAPGQYGAPRQLAPGGEALDRWLRDRLVLATVRELAEHGMVGWMDGWGFEWAGWVGLLSGLAVRAVGRRLGFAMRQVPAALPALACKSSSLAASEIAAALLTSCPTPSAIICRRPAHATTIAPGPAPALFPAPAGATA
jgi:hypothetical protein